MPIVSIIIPTHNRCEALGRTLKALSHQTFSPLEFEVIVVDDGCHDRTAEIVSTYPAPFTLRLVEQPGLGPAAARNAGAAQAKAPLLIFLDDDIATAPGFVAEHVKTHTIQAGGVVIGYLPPLLTHQTGFFRAALRGWWEAMFERMRMPGHRFTYKDLLTGNLSISADVFHTLGGFDTDFWCHEDYEFGVRLHQSGIPFAFSMRAWGYHHDISDINRILHRKFDEGKADVQLGRKYPALRPTLLMWKLHHYSLLLSFLMQLFAFYGAFVGDVMLRMVQRMLGGLEWWRLRWLWRRTMDGLMAYWYWRGVAQELKNPVAVAAFIAKRPPKSHQKAELDLDLVLGLETLEQQLDAMRPASACIRHGAQVVGIIPARPGAERLRGKHLRQVLATDLRVALLRAQALAGVLDIPGGPEPLIAACDTFLAYWARHKNSME